MLVYLHCIMPSVIEPGRLPQLLFLTHQDPWSGGGERREKREQHNIPRPRQKYRSFIMKQIMVEIELASTKHYL